MLSSLRGALPIALCLFVAGATASPGHGDAVWRYRIRDGDTLVALQQRLLVPGADWRVLQTLNDIADPRRLVVGREILVPVALLRVRPVRAAVVFVHGEVRLRGADGERTLAAGDTVGAGDEVFTAQTAASAVLRLDDGSRILLEPGSRLRIESLVQRGPSPFRESTLQLQHGGAEAQVTQAPARPPRPRLRIRTPLVNLAVRGTEFRARADAAGTRLEVVEGRVAAGPRAVDAGFGLVADGDGVGRPLALLPAPSLPAELPRVEQMPLALDWAPVDGAAGYRAQILADEGDDDRLLLDGRFAGPAADWSEDLPDGRYRLRVRAADGAGLEGRDAVGRFELKARPEPPMALAPAATADAGEIDFRWTRHPQAVHYRLQVAGDAGFEAPLIDRDAVADTALTATLPPGRYQWRLRSVRAGGDAGPWSAPRPLSLVEPPPAPPESPQADAASDRVALAWRPSPRPGVRYEVQVARDAAFADIVAEDRTDAPAFAFEPPGAGVYHVRVRTVAADGRPGAYGTPQQVEVPPAWRWWWLLPALLWLV